MELREIREEKEKIHKELNANNNSLKDALAKAMQSEKERAVPKKEVEEVEEKVKEVPEKVLRELVDEE